MKIKTTCYLTITTILIFANVLTRTPLYPEDITSQPVIIRQLATDPNAIMYSAPYSESEYERSRTMSMSDRSTFNESRQWMNNLRMDILERIENRGRAGYDKLAQSLPDRARQTLAILGIEQ